MDNYENRLVYLLEKLANHEEVSVGETGFQPLNRLEQWLLCLINKTGIEDLGDPMNALEYLIKAIYESDDGIDSAVPITKDFSAAKYLGTTEVFQSTVERQAYSKVTVKLPKPSGTTTLNTNGLHDVMQYEKATVNVAPYGTGNVNISANGTHNVNGKATATVNVPIPSGYVLPTGTKEITANASGVDVYSFSKVDVAVPIPDGYIVPTGAKTITANGNDIDVTAFSKVNVNVPIPDGYLVPTGTKEVNANGTGIDVSSYAMVDVNVPIPDGYVLPTGTITITENKENVDVTNVAAVSVQVETPPAILSVTELPTENISTTQLYKIEDSLYSYDEETGWSEYTLKLPAEAE